jgi:DNA-binding transcriptional ArsR family regulator
MAKKSKTGGKDFKKGQSGNPDGRPPLSPEIKALRGITNERIKEVMDLLIDQDITALEVLAQSETEPTLKVLYAAGILRAIKEGNPGHIESVLNRVIGKPKDHIEHTGKDGGAIETRAELVVSILDRVAQVKGDK